MAVRPNQQNYLKPLLLVPIVVSLVILWQAQNLYGSCKAPSEVENIEALQSYLIETSNSVRKRSQAAANTLQQLASDISQHGTKAQQLQQDLNETRGNLESSKHAQVQLMTEVTSLKGESGKQQQELRQKDDEIKRGNAEVEKLQQQLKEKDQQQQEELQKLQQQIKEAKQQLEKKEPTQQAGSAGPLLPADAVEGRLHLLEVAGLQCNAVKDQEFWADPIVWGYEHRAQDAAECCAACHALNAAIDRGGSDKGRNGTRCNVWAFCVDPEGCQKRLGECWLKHQNKPLSHPPNLPPDAKASKAWISGAIYPDDQHLHRYNGSKMVLHTTLGDIEIQLLPEQAPGSIRELTRMAWLLSQGLTTCSNCRIYRPEPNFLVQGLMEAAGSYVAVPRHPNPQQPMKMTRGMVCWAGGTGGPHWFVNLVDQTRFKDEHLCWGQVADMTLFDKIVNLPKRDKKPGQMNELVDHIRYNISLKAT